jgi:hypothetical protein
MEYKIEVITTPHIHDSPKKPYFWCIMSHSQNGSWCNYTSGWAATIEEAWQEAKTFYNKYLNERKN